MKPWAIVVNFEIQKSPGITFDEYSTSYMCKKESEKLSVDSHKDRTALEEPYTCKQI